MLLISDGLTEEQWLAAQERVAFIGDEPGDALLNNAAHPHRDESGSLLIVHDALGTQRVVPVLDNG